MKLKEKILTTIVAGIMATPLIYGAGKFNSSKYIVDEKHDDVGRIIEKSIDYLGDNKPEVTYKFSYNSENNLVKKITNCHNGGREDDLVNIFTYNSDNELTKSWHIIDGKLIAITTYEFDSDKNLVNCCTTSAYGNWKNISNHKSE
jgi:hypothetical protein